MKHNFKQGIFTPRYPEKWVLSKKSITDGKYIRYMSSYELKAFHFFDLNQGIEKISSEPFPIQYLSPVDNKIHRYYPDVLVKNKDGKKFLVEIKPYCETIPPKQPKRITKKTQASYVRALETYEINQAKWESAKNFCKRNNIEFLILTEKELQI